MVIQTCYAWMTAGFLCEHRNWKCEYTRYDHSWDKDRAIGGRYKTGLLMRGQERTEKSLSWEDPLC